MSVSESATSSRSNAPTVWIAAAGAVIFLFGIGYGLKVSIERGWFAPPMRVFTGAVAGMIFGGASVLLFRKESNKVGVALLLAGVGAWDASMFYGSNPQMAGLFNPWVGFGGTLLATVLAGLLGARMRSDGAMAVAVIGGLKALHSFSNLGHAAWFSLTYLLILVIGQLLTYYLTQTGGQWIWSRLAGVTGTCLSVVLLVNSVQREDALLNAVLAGMIGTNLLVMAWLPAHRDIPWAPGAATVVVQISLGAIWFDLWRLAHFQAKSFSVVMILLGFLSLALLRPARRRVGHDRHDMPLLFLFTGFVFVGAAMALDWKWISLVWGAMASLTARAALASKSRIKVNAGGLGFVAQIAAIAASVVWLSQVSCRTPAAPLFLNPLFVGGALTALAWGQLAMGVPSRLMAFLILEVFSVNLIAIELARALPDLQIEGLTLPVGSLLSTVVYAIAGAAQWLAGIKRDTAFELRKPLRIAGYSWLAAAVLKLLLYDLGGADLLLRAAATLTVGAIFIGAALWANYYIKRNALRDS
jgi:hypothetical protein